MCCIFTCCGWVIDLFQRFWTFAMSCFISSAVCCSMVTASMSGVALGYNYSLAEYIELKETNVSVYLKRGVFDDEVVDEMDWRRGGGGPAAAKAEESTPVQQDPYTSGRRSGSIFDAETTKARLDESMFQSDEHHRFEGSLLKLTAKPVDLAAPGYPTRFTQEAEVGSYPQDSVEQTKVVQSLVNRRKMEHAFTTETIQVPGEYNVLQVPNEELKSIQDQLNQRRLAARKFATSRPTKVVDLHPVATYPTGLFTPSDRPPRPGDHLSDGRRMMESGTTELSDIMSLVRAQENEKGPPKWYQPKPPRDGNADELAPLITVKTPRPGPLRPRIYMHPTRVVSETTQHKQHTSTELNSLRRFNEDFLSKNLMKEKLGVVPNVVDEKEYADAIKAKDYNDDEIKGLPLRKRRDVKITDSPYINHIHKEETDNQIQDDNRKSLLDILLNLITSINAVFMYDIPDKEGTQQSDNSNDTARMSKSDLISNALTDFDLAPTEAFIMKIIKSPVVVT